MSKNLLWAFFSLCILVPSAHGMPCHCFPNRTFDSAKPAASAPYFLATTQNAFLAVVFGQEKRDVVLAKQKPGVTAEGFWIAHWLAQKSGKEAGELFRARHSADSWRGAMTALHVDQQKLPPQFMTLLNEAADEAALSRFIIDTLLIDKGFAPRGELENMRRDGATDQETILASIIARKGGQRGSRIFTIARKNETSWGGLLLKAGLDGGNMVNEIRTLIKDGKGKP